MDRYTGISSAPQTTPASVFTKRLGEFIELHALVKAQVAKRAGMTPQHLNRILREGLNISLSTAVSLCEAVGTSLPDMLKENGSFSERLQAVAATIAGAAASESPLAEWLDVVRALAVDERQLARLESVVAAVHSPIERLADISSARSWFIPSVADWLQSWRPLSDASEETQGSIQWDAALQNAAVENTIKSLGVLSNSRVNIVGKDLAWPITPTTLEGYVTVQERLLQLSLSTQIANPVLFSVTSLLPSQWYDREVRIAGSLSGYRESIRHVLAHTPQVKVHRLIVTAKETDGKAEAFLIRSGLLGSSEISNTSLEDLQSFVVDLHSKSSDARYLELTGEARTSIGGEQIDLRTFTRTFKRSAASLFDLLLIGQFKSATDAFPQWICGVTGSMNLSEDVVPLGILMDHELITYVGSFWYSMFHSARLWEDILRGLQPGCSPGGDMANPSDRELE